MSLQVYAYEKVKLVISHEEATASMDDMEQSKLTEEQDLRCFYNLSTFADRGRPDGYYETSGTEFTFGMAHHHYTHWRVELCRAILGVEPPREVWNNPEKYENKPFFNLIHFADNEGNFLPELCRGLAKDFAEHRAVIHDKFASHPDRDWFIKTYENFAKAFLIASGDDGAVEFA